MTIKELTCLNFLQETELILSNIKDSRSIYGQHYIFALLDFRYNLSNKFSNTLPDNWEEFKTIIAIRHEIKKQLRAIDKRLLRACLKREFMARFNK